jgi:gliding motility-associated-like protein
MKALKIIFLLSIFLVVFNKKTIACTPCGALSNVTQTLTGTNLALTFSSNAGWQCCYTVQIEIVCANANFTGSPNFFSAENCINGGGGSSSTFSGTVPYPTTNIDLSGYCAGNYKWRARETSCNIYTPEYQFTLGGASPIQIALNASQSTICSNQNTNLSANASDGCSSNNFTYLWSPATGLSNPNIANPVASPSATTTYTLTVSEAGTCTLPQTSNLTITVNPLIVATLNGTVSVCQNAPNPTLTFTGSGGTAPYTINYTINGAPQTAIVTAGTSTITAPTTTPGVYTYSVTNIQDANSLQCPQNVNASAVVTINLLPIVDAGQDQTICLGQNVTLTATNATIYNWNNPTITNGIPFTPAATATYSVTGTTGLCSSTDQITVNVNPSAAINAGTDVTICYGETAVCIATGGVTYIWDNNVTNGVAFTPQTTANYTVAGIDVNGCAGTDQMTINVVPIPIVNFTANVTSGCIPLTVFFNNLNPVNNSFQWILGDGTSSNNPNTATTTYNSAGCYDITLIATTPEGCIGQTTYPSMICTFDNPVADFTVNPPVLSLLETTTNMVNASTGANTYIWNFGDATGTSVIENPEHTFPSEFAASYQITLIAYSVEGCSDTAKVNIEIQDEIIYYIPNTFTPDQDEHNPVFKPIFTSGFDPNDYKMVIYNRWGELLFESNDVNYGWDGTYNGTHGIVKDDTYTWKIEFKTLASDERKLLMGSVKLLR